MKHYYYSSRFCHCSSAESKEAALAAVQLTCDQDGEPDFAAAANLGLSHLQGVTPSQLQVLTFDASHACCM